MIMGIGLHIQAVQQTLRKTNKTQRPIQTHHISGEDRHIEKHTEDNKTKRSIIYKNKKKTKIIDRNISLETMMTRRQQDNMQNC